MSARMRRVGCRRVLLSGALMLGLAGIGQVGAAGWIHAKALVAQVLLERAWERTGAEQAVPPWPGADTVPVARLRAPSQGVDQIVLDGATGESLAFGPAKLAASATPGAGHTVIAGHRDTHFAFLRRLTPGDRLVLRRPGGPTRRYEVTTREVVNSRQRRLALGSGDRLTLVTCYPFDAVEPGGPMRFVVMAEPVATDG